MMKKKWLIVSLVIMFVITSFGTMISAKTLSSADSDGSKNVPAPVSGCTEYTFYFGTLSGTGEWTLYDHSATVTFDGPAYIDGTLKEKTDIKGLTLKNMERSKFKWTTLHLEPGDGFRVYVLYNTHYSDSMKSTSTGSGSFWVKACPFRAIISDGMACAFHVYDYN
jgi:hypothetical protein